MVGTTKFRITNKEVLDFLSSEDRQKCNSLIFTNVQKDELGEEITVTCLCFNDEDKEEEMYLYIKNRLTSKHYYHYEISNYAKEGYESKHNINYWNNGNYYGFGMGAVSYLDNYRISNTKSLTKYMDNKFLLNKEFETDNVQISNSFMLGLRMKKGININKFKDKYNKDILSIKNVKKLINEEKLILDNNHLYIADKYFYLSNEIIMEFIDI